MRPSLSLALGGRAPEGGVVVAAPVNTVAPVISGSTTLGSTLTGTDGTWSNAPTSFARQWRRAGVDIPGATGSTYDLTLADSGAAITLYVEASNAGGTAGATSNTITASSFLPVNTAAPTVSGTVGPGNVLTANPGTWSNTPSSYTYQWKRSGVAIAGETSSTLAHLPANTNPGAAITCDVAGANSVGTGAAVGSSNSLAFNADTFFPETAIGVCTSGITTADAGTTGDQWAASLGGEKAAVVLAAPAATNRPAYSASGGPGGRPMLVFDGVDNVLRSTGITFGGTWQGWRMDVVGFLAGAETSADRIFSYGSSFNMGVSGTPQLRCVASGGTTFAHTGTITATHRQLTYRGDGTLHYAQINEGTPSSNNCVNAPYADGQPLALGASSTGTAAVAISVLGFALTRGPSAGDSLTANQRVALRELFQNLVGVA